jgi:integrase
MKFQTQTYKMASGERSCLLVDEFGMPAFSPTLYITTQVRNAGKSVATAEQCLSGIKILLEFCDNEQIDLDERIRTGFFLTPSEIDLLRDACQERRGTLNISNVRSLKKGYSPPKRKVKTATTYLYITRIADYLKWLCRHHLGNLHFTKETACRVDAFVAGIEARRPFVMGRNIDDGAYRGISDSQECLLFEIMRPGDPRNPFINPGVQIRNYLIVKLLRLMGPRGGELLNVQITDFDFSANQLRIVRRADAPEDHRTRQPRVKTQQRVLPLSCATMSEVRCYIVEVRKRIPNAARDPYLFVAHKSGPTQGKALSISSLHEMFHTIAAAHPELDGVTAHDLRHRWHVVFSEAMDSQSEVSHVEAEQWRNLLAGWKTGSAQGRHYAARHIRSQAHKVMLREQERFEQEVSAKQSE